MRCLPALLIAVLPACTQPSRATSDSATAVLWDSTAASEARAAAQKGVDAFVAADIEGVKSVFAPDGFITSYDIDLENRPLRLPTRDDAVKYAEDTFAELKKMNATLRGDVKGMDCRGTSVLAYCALDFDLAATLADGKTMSQPSRATIVLAKGAEGWKWVHWHTSIASAPPATTAK